MASTVFPQTVSPIKSIQRGIASSAGNITISSIDTSKSFIRSYSTSSYSFGGTGGGNASSGGGSFPSYLGTRTTTAGSTSITVSEYGAYIVNSTTITATGSCRWEVVEYS